MGKDRPGEDGRRALKNVLMSQGRFARCGRAYGDVHKVPSGPSLSVPRVLL